jgi:hypothetical protein
MSMDQPRELSATETEVTHAMTAAGWNAHRCMDAWTEFTRDGRQIFVNWTDSGEIDNVDGLTPREVISLLAGQAAPG